MASKKRKKPRTPLGELSVMEQRVERIFQLMSTGLWVRGRSHRLLMEEWGVSETVVKTAAAEAGRRMRSLWREHEEELRTAFVAELADIRLRARSSVRRRQRKVWRRDPNGERFLDYEDVEDPRPEFHAEITAVLAAAELMGLRVQRVEISNPDADPFTGWTEAELEAFARTGRRPKRSELNGKGSDDGSNGSIH